MRTRYKILFTLILIILSYMFIGTNSVQANNNYVVSSLYFGITEYRTLSEPNFGYSLGNPVTGGANAAKIWNISQYGLLPAFYVFILIASVGFMLAVWGLFDKKDV